MSMYYSFSVGPVHFVQLSTETPFDTADVDPSQASWVWRDLQNSRINGDTFVVVSGHRPFYCSSAGKDCASFAGLLREQLEEAFHALAVDIVISGHKYACFHRCSHLLHASCFLTEQSLFHCRHNYERSLPVYRGQPTSFSNSSYTSPSAPIYIVNGAAGNREGNGSPPSCSRGAFPWCVRASSAQSGAVG
jgi:hypothetical protein